MISYETRFGKIGFSNEYFTTLIGNAVTSCFGVADMAPTGTLQKLSRFFTKGKDSTGVSVSGDINSITVNLHIIVGFGMNISAIAKSITHKVKYVVEEATGIKVDKVTICVDGVKNN